MRYLRITREALLLFLLMAAPLAGAAAQDIPAPAVRSDLLVSTDWLATRLNDPGVVVLHVAREKAHYDAGHIPGARFIAWGEITATRDGVPNELAPIADLQKVFDRVGVGEKSRVILYGDQNGLSAARAFFTLEYLGLAGRAAVLDGGMEKWQDDKRTISTDAAPAVAAAFRPRVQPDAVTGMDVVKDISWAVRNVPDPGFALIDARPVAEYTGATPGEGVTRPGHIPGAANIFWIDNLVSKENPVLKPVAELARMYQAAGARPGARVVTYCRTGGQAAHAYFVARYLGYDVVLYDGSFAEWNRAADTPVETGTPAK